MDSDQGAIGGAEEISGNLAAIWSEVLGVLVAPTDDFFALGGDSISATHVMSMASESFGVELPLFLIFSHTTVAELALQIEQSSVAVKPQLVVNLRVCGNDPALYCIPAAATTVYSLRELITRFKDDQPFSVIESCGLVSGTEPQSLVEDMAQTYNAAIREQQPSGPYFLAGRCFGGIVAFEMARQFVVAGEGVGLLALLDTAVPAAKLEPILAALEPDEQQRITSIYSSDRVCHRWMRVSIQEEFHNNSEHAADDVRAMVMAVDAAHTKALTEYVPVPIDVPITVFRGREGHWTERISWDLFTRSTYRNVELEGDRVSMFERPFVFALSAALSDAFREACACERAKTSNA